MLAALVDPHILIHNVLLEGIINFRVRGNRPVKVPEPIAAGKSGTRHAFALFANALLRGRLL